ncbi:hypothetical protein L0128_09835 [candidate division KSB1 bacterium]|nr:hypothetical protein [candidate division KSB1 bacterium]
MSKLFIWSVLLLFINCSQDYVKQQRQLQQQRQKQQPSPQSQGSSSQSQGNFYQPRSENVRKSSTQTATPAANQGQPVYIVAVETLSEPEALREAQKYRNYGFKVEIYTNALGSFLVTVGSSTNANLSQQFRDKYVQARRLPGTAYCSPATGWRGPLLGQTETSLTTVPPPPATTPPTSFYSSEPATPNLTGNYYLVLARTQTEASAIQVAIQYIAQGLIVFVYETTVGYAITLDKALPQSQAEAKRQQALREGKVTNITLVPDGPEWKGIVYP